MYKMVIGLIALIFFLTTEVCGIVIGSYSSVGRNPSSTFFPADDTDNEIRGFVHFDNGFALEAGNTTCTFDGYFPVMGKVSLNSATLQMARTIELGSNATIETGGAIEGEGSYSLYCPKTNIIEFPIQKSQEEASWLEFISEDQLNSPGRAVDWSPLDDYIAILMNNGNIRIYSFDGTLPSQEVASGAMGKTGYDVAWNPSNNYIVAVGDSSGGGAEVQIFYFDPNAGTPLSLVASVVSGSDVRAVSWHPNGSEFLIYRDGNPNIQVYTFTPPSTLTAGDTYNVGNNMRGHGIDWSPMGDYFVVGNNSGANPHLYVFSWDGTNISLETSENTQRIMSVDWSSKDNYIAVGFRQNDRIELWQYDEDANTLTEFTSGTIPFNNEDPRRVQWSNGGGWLLVGRNEGTDTPTSAEFAVYSFDDSTQTFSVEKLLNVSANVQAVAWSHDNKYVARGDNRSYVGAYYGYSFNFGPQMTVSDTKLSFDSDVIINASVLFQNNSFIDAAGRTIEFKSTGTLIGKFIVDAGASLIIQNATMKNINENNIELNDGSVLGLRNIRWYQEDTVTFTQGYFDFYGDVLISGTGAFVYESDEISTINDNSCLHFDSGMTFSYATTSSRDLLQFVDETSILHLYETTLYSVIPGIQFKKGTIVVEGTCPVINNATDETDGVWLGDGTSENNSVLKIVDESGFDVRSGYLVYKNV